MPIARIIDRDNIIPLLGKRLLNRKAGAHEAIESIKEGNISFICLLIPYPIIILE